MSEKKAGPKENLTWKINMLAAQVGEKTHMKAAMIAASKAKYQQKHSKHVTKKLSPEQVKEELYNARKLKLEQKLYQARKDLKQVMKKAKQVESQKQIRKIKLGKEENEKDLEVIKNIDLDLLVDKTIKNKLEKNNELKNEQHIKELVELLTDKKLDDKCSQNIASRFMSNKLVLAQVNQIITSFQNIIKGNNEKIEKRKADEEKKKKLEEKKRKKEQDQVQNKKPRITSSSEFMETLGGGGIIDDEKQDENFEAIYEGVKKPNRIGQRQRRKQWEEKYGREANHIVKEYQKREEKRLENPDYRPKKKPTVKKPVLQKHQMTSTEPVHPSWEAKKLQEEIMSKALSGKIVSNNKITFE